MFFTIISLIFSFFAFAARTLATSTSTLISTFPVFEFYYKELAKIHSLVSKILRAGHPIGLLQALKVDIVYLILKHLTLRPVIYLDFSQVGPLLLTTSPGACVASIEDIARASYNRLMVIARAQTVARFERNRNATRTVTSHRSSNLIDREDVSISHRPDPDASVDSSSRLYKPHTVRSIFIRRTYPASDRFERQVNDMAESAHMPLRNTDSDDYLDGPNRDRKVWLVNAFRRRSRSKVEVFDGDDDDLGPIDPSWF